ncbi:MULTISPECIES: AAA family ATPase [unclassified Shinella]|uniref:AAA family ATPase n=1 Tax=unclassified Shinella TaxID=2643062 RepID=UPI0030C8798F
MVTTNSFLRLAALGYKRLVPIIPPNAEISETSSLHRQIGKATDPRGKAVGVKGRNGKWYGFDWLPHEANEDDYHRYHGMGAGVGIKTGNGLVLIDADTSNPDHAQIIYNALREIVPTVFVRIGNKPKAGYLVRTDADFRYVRIEFGERDDKGRLLDRVEILAEGRQFVALGIHPKTGKPYDWPMGVPAYDDVPYISGADLTALLERLRTLLPAASPIVKEGATTDVNQNALRGELERVRAAVRATPNTSDLFPTREAYRDFGYAIKAALPDNQHEAFELFEEWCDRWTGGTNDPDTVQSDWKRMKPPFRRGAGWLYELADTHSQGAFTTACAFFDDLGEVEQNPFAQQIELNALKEKSSKFVFLNFDEAAEAAKAASNRPLIKGFIDQGTMSVGYGDSNVGKTFVFMDVAYHVAAGIDYAGMRTTQARVVYVAAEGGNGAKRRVQALKDKYGALADPSAFLLLPSPVDLRRADADLNPFLEALRAIGAPIGLIVVDTLSRALAGGDENSSVDMGAIVKHFDVIRNATGAHLMIVHHTGKNKANGARGHSLLRAATDTEIEVEEGQIAVTKQRDLERSWSSAFALEVRTLGMDEDGDRITSCTVRLVPKAEAEAEAKKGEPTIAEARVLRGLAYILVGSSLRGQGATLEQLMSSSAEILSGMNAELVRAHLRNLKMKGHVAQPKRGFWGLPDGELSKAILSDQDILSEEMPLNSEDFASSELNSARSSGPKKEESGRKRKTGIFD